MHVAHLMGKSASSVQTNNIIYLPPLKLWRDSVKYVTLNHLSLSYPKMDTNQSTYKTKLTEPVGQRRGRITGINKNKTLIIFKAH